uniref:NADH dehydrogenase subunit 6 n=1 Tax=Proasellus hercegovinensis TaxID=1281977 RepID=A0A485M9V5_9CRUS|nr:NADH dehydrogenase subunit 6 [Proasellus hercegovinensis]
MLFLMFLLSGLFLASSSPHLMIMTLLASTFLATLILGAMKTFPWVAYILFLVFLGGILILFTYISSLSSNPLFKKVKLEIFIPMIFMSIFMLAYNLPPMLMEVNSHPIGVRPAELAMKELFSPLVYPLYLYLFSYLLITLLYVVTIMKTYYTPLRKTL